MKKPERIAPLCGLCRERIRNASWLRHNGAEVHADCWLATGDAPDSVRRVGLYAPNAIFGEAIAS